MRTGYSKLERKAAKLVGAPLSSHSSFAIHCDEMRGRLPAIVPPLASAGPAISTASSIFFGPRFVHIQRPAVQVASVQCVDGSLPVAVIGHLHESEPSGLSGIPIGHDVYAANRPKFLKHGSNGAFSRVETEVSYENVLHLFFFLQLAEQQMRAG